ncbi:ATP-binding protein, partial [Escherichia coli]
VGMVLANRCHRQNMKTSIINGSEVSRLSVAIQLPVENWYKMIGDSTHADAILDRLVHGSIKIELKGESMRKIQSPLTEGDQ